MVTNIEEAARRLATGEVIAFPTETFYGLAADPGNPVAVEALLDLKDRSLNQGIPLIAGSAESANRVAADRTEELKAKRISLQDAFWPGPLTAVFDVNDFAKSTIHHGVFGPNNTLAVRVSSLETARLLAAAAPLGLITSTSANPKGEPPSASSADVRRYFPDLYLLEGEDKTPEDQLPSTLVMTSEVPFKVLREGAISSDELKDWL
jgi:L-threonylcarbamoyladenylate synthase